MKGFSHVSWFYKKDLQIATDYLKKIELLNAIENKWILKDSFFCGGKPNNS
jgi:hypothetical protein